MKVLLIFILFTIELNEVSINSLGDSVIIVLDEFYCKDCLNEIAKINNIWEPEFKTVLIVRSKQNKFSTLYYSKFYKQKLAYSDIYFFENDFKPFIEKNKIKKTPFLIIKKKESLTAIVYDFLFQIGLDSSLFKKTILKNLAK